MTKEGRTIGDRKVVYEDPMTSRQPPEREPSKVDAKAAVSIGLALLGILMMVAAAFGLWGGWAAMFTGGFVIASMAILIGWDNA